MKIKSLIVSFFVLAGTFNVAFGQVILGIYGPDGTQSSVSENAGGSFSAPVIVSGLTSDAALDLFDLTFSLPAGITITGYTDTVPDGWIPLPSATNSNQYGGFNFFGSDLTGTNTLVIANLSIGANVAPGTYTVGFIAPEADHQDLTDGNGNPISYTEQDLTVNVGAAPEPASSVLLLLGLGSLALYRFRYFRGRKS